MTGDLQEELLLRQGWKPVSLMPKRLWCRTKRLGEKGHAISMWVPGSPEPGDDTREYFDPDGYSTIVNPGSFAEPTHWREITPQDLMILMQKGRVQVKVQQPRSGWAKRLTFDDVERVVREWEKTPIEEEGGLTRDLIQSIVDLQNN